MIMWLDHKIFGNGYGLRSPYFDNKFYWLVDTKHGRDKGRGAFYTFMHGLGAQLHSFQWFHPNAGEERVLAGYRFSPLHSSRRWLRVDGVRNLAPGEDRITAPQSPAQVPSVEEVAKKDALIACAASLAAAISLLERIPNAAKATASDKMFKQMLNDYRRALETGRAVLRGEKK